MPTRSTIMLQRNGQHVSISEEHLSLLGDLTIRRLMPTADPQHGYDVRKEKDSLLRSPKGYRIPNAGVISLLRELANQRGFTLMVKASPPIAQLPEPTDLDQLEYPKLAQFVRQQERGLIRVRKSFDEVIIVRELAAAYPKQKIIVLGNQVERLRTITEQMRGQNRNTEKSQRVELAHSRHPLFLDVDQEMPQVTCSTYGEAANLDFATSDIVLFLDGYECVHNQAQLALEAMDAQFCLFGIVRAGQNGSPYEKAITMRVFGPEVVDLMTHGRTRRDVHVAWGRHHQPAIRLERNGADFDYQCLFHNERRNRVIATIAKALAAGNPLAPNKFPQINEWCDFNGHNTHRVTVLVDRLDHAVALGKKLPDWPLFTPRNTSTHGYPGSVRGRLKRGRSLWAGGSPWEYGRRQIVTTDAATSFCGTFSNVVIWAGGSPCMAPIPGFWLGQKRDLHHPLLIVDFLDLFNTQTREWSKQRRDDYAQKDIFDVGVDPALGRMERFLGIKFRGEE